MAKKTETKVTKREVTSEVAELEKILGQASSEPEPEPEAAAVPVALMPLDELVELFEAYTPEPETPAEATSVAEAPASTPEPDVALDPEALIASAPPELREKLAAMFGKINAEKAASDERAKALEAQVHAGDKAKKDAAAWETFVKYVRTELVPGTIAPKMKELGIETLNKRLVITFPGGKVDEAGAGSKSDGGKGDGKREKVVRWGKGIIRSEGGHKEATFGSPGEAAKSLGLQVLHRDSMHEVFEKPMKGYTDEEAKQPGFQKVFLPKIYRVVEAIREQHFIVEVLDKPLA